MWNKKKKKEPEIPLTFEEEVLLKLKVIETRTQKIEKTVNGINAFIWGFIIFSIISAVVGEILTRIGF
ncbi:MAG: hypothetical protein QNJ68_10395 [Microcoleaceae cyanobacterium MO_207.B10]|nr:hypothetical protein [Microcoleaceae cyanobacterium MO_207.B10]